MNFTDRSNQEEIRNLPFGFPRCCFKDSIAYKCRYDFEGSLTGDKAVSVSFDNTKIKRLAPDLKTNVPLHKGVRIALEYILNHKECMKEDPEFDKWCDKVIATLENAKKTF